MTNLENTTIVPDLTEGSFDFNDYLMGVAYPKTEVVLYTNYALAQEYYNARLAFEELSLSELAAESDILEAEGLIAEVKAKLDGSAIVFGVTGLEPGLWTETWKAAAKVVTDAEEEEYQKKLSAAYVLDSAEAKKLGRTVTRNSVLVKHRDVSAEANEAGFRAVSLLSIEYFYPFGKDKIFGNIDSNFYDALRYKLNASEVNKLDEAVILVHDGAKYLQAGVTAPFLGRVSDLGK